MRDGNKLYVWAIAVLPAEGTSAISHEVDEAEVIIIFASKKALWPNCGRRRQQLPTRLSKTKQRNGKSSKISSWLQPI